MSEYIESRLTTAKIIQFHLSFRTSCTCPSIKLMISLALVVPSARGNISLSKGLFTWSGGPRSSGVSFFCFHALGDTKQKKLTPLDRGPPLHVNGV